MLAKVLSWWGSRLGGSAPITASRTPPRRGVSAAVAAPGTVAASQPRTRASTTKETSRGRTRMGAVMEHLLRESATVGMTSEGPRLRGIRTSPGLHGARRLGKPTVDDLRSRRLRGAEAVSDGSHLRTRGPYQGRDGPVNRGSGATDESPALPSPHEPRADPGGA